MNSLSWLLYLSDVVPSLGVVFGICGFVSFGIGVVLLVYGSVERENAYFAQPGFGLEARLKARETTQWQAGYAVQKKAFKAASFILLFALLATAVPSKQTILMIAASEMGETVVRSPEAQEIFTDLKAVLKRQLETMKK